MMWAFLIACAIGLVFTLWAACARAGQLDEDAAAVDDWRSDREAWGLTQDQYRRYLQRLRFARIAWDARADRAAAAAHDRHQLWGIAFAVSAVMALVATAWWMGAS